MCDSAVTTGGERVRECDRLARMCLYLGGGLGALALIGSGDMAATVLDTPGRRTGFLLVTLLGGAAVGTAYSNFTYLAARLQRAIRRPGCTVTGETSLDDARSTGHEVDISAGNKVLYWASSVALVVSASMLLAFAATSAPAA